MNHQKKGKTQKKKREIPKYNLPIFETHCHLDYLKEFPITEVLKQAREVGVREIISITVAPEGLNHVLEIAQNFPNIFCTQGLHPHEAKKWRGSIESQISKNAQDPHVLAIGEIGLDFYYNHSPKEKQREVFKKQLQMAIDLDLPVVIHSREADLETLEILEETAPQMKKKGVIHSFTSGEELAQRAIELGFFLGFNGIITFKNATALYPIVKNCPLERILLETDAPFLCPSPYRGRENAPRFLPFIAEKIAELKETSIEEVLKKTYKNSQDLFSPPKNF